MNRRGASSKAPIVLLFLLVVVVVGAVAAYKLWPSMNFNAGPKGDPDAPGVDTSTGPPITAAAKVDPSKPVQVPFIFWGGDVATFVANGGLTTTKGSTFDRQGLNVALTKGDDFPQQVKDYLDNKSPFLRGTLSMLGQVSDQLTAKPETQPVVFLQLTWSAGDHFVGRANFKTLNDIKGKKIAIQSGGPHVGMLNDILRTAQVDWKDINVVWTDDVTGPKGPAALFRMDPTIDACFAISPDMSDLTGGLEKKGDGKNNTVDGAHVVVSTAYMNHSIADVYACRRDFWEGNKEWVEKFTAGYLKGCEDLGDAKTKATPAYKDAIHLAQSIWGKYDDLKDSVAKEDDVDGLISDSTFVGLPGNVTFFTAKGNLTGFPFKLTQALQLPADPAKDPPKVGPKGFRLAGLDYEALRKLGGLNGQQTKRNYAEISFDDLEEKTIYSFTIHFAADSHDFSEAEYGKDFQRALEEASLFGNAVVAIRGHATPVNLVPQFLNAAEAQGIVTFNQGTDTYTGRDGKKFDLNNIQNVLDAIDKNPGLTYSYKDDDGKTVSGPVSDSVKYLQKLSEDRAAGVRQTIIKFAQSKNLVLEESQLQSQGVGVKDPVVAYPQNEEESAKNRRVEFSIVKLPAGQL